MSHVMVQRRACFARKHKDLALEAKTLEDRNGLKILAIITFLTTLSPKRNLHPLATSHFISCGEPRTYAVMHDGWFHSWQNLERHRRQGYESSLLRRSVCHIRCRYKNSNLQHLIRRLNLIVDPSWFNPGYPILVPVATCPAAARQALETQGWIGYRILEWSTISSFICHQLEQDQNLFPIFWF